MRYIFQVLLALVLSSGLKAQTNLDSLITDGIELIYQFEFDRAEDVFNKAIEIDSRLPSSYHYIAQMHLWFFLGTRDLGEFTIFNKFSDLALEKAEVLLENDDENPENNFILALIHTNRALAFSSQDEFLSAFWESKSAYGYFEDVLDIDSSYTDAYFGLGLFDYALSFVPGMFKWAVSLVGLDYDKERGLNLLLKAYNGGGLMKTEAAFHLSNVYADYIAEYDSAAFYLDETIKSYPNNILFHYQKAVLNIKAGNLDEAEVELDKVIELKIPQFEQTNSLALFLKGDVYFRRNDFDKAFFYYSDFINSTHSVDYTGIANLRMAISLSMLGKNLEAKKYLLFARQGNLDIVDDEYANRKSEEYFDLWMSEEYKKVILSENNIHAKNYDSVISILQNEVEKFSSEDFQAMGYCYLAEAKLNNNEFTIALELVEKAMSKSTEKENWTYPYAALIKAELLYKNAQNESALVTLETADDNNDFDFQLKIEARINRLKRTISSRL